MKDKSSPFQVVPAKHNYLDKHEVNELFARLATLASGLAIKIKYDGRPVLKMQQAYHSLAGSRGLRIRTRDGGDGILISLVRTGEERK